MARRLGQRGGLARARRLSAERRREIASLGGEARLRSILAAKRIADNFRYLTAVLALQGGPPEVARPRSPARGRSTAGCPGSTRIGPELEKDETHLESVGRIVAALEDIGCQPVLVGGMALVVLGSRRVTRDFDFVVAGPGAQLPRLLDAFYDRGLELASRVNAAEDVIATIDNRRVAASRLRMDAPSSAHFQHPRTGLRIDLLFDFPVPAAALAERATSARISSIVLRIASEADLLQLKILARAGRSSPGDTEDIAFLEARRAKP